jgi:hypothetical protein
MKRAIQIRLGVMYLILLCLFHQHIVYAIENYTLNPLFDLKTGQGIDEFLFGYAPAPFAPAEGRKIPLIPIGTHVLVNNSGDFYLLKERTNIIKINSIGQVVGEIKGTTPFTIPIVMKLDGEDNLYVKFRNDTHIGENFRYVVSKFNSQGDLLQCIGEGEAFKCISFGVDINGIVSLQSCETEADPDQFIRYDKNGSLMGLITHQQITYRDTSDTKVGKYSICIGHILEMGMDNNVYAVNNFDYTIDKYGNYRNLSTTRGIEPVEERKVFSWMQIGSKYDFQGFDVNNKMYFYYFPDRRIEKQVELPKDSYVKVLNFSQPLKFEAFRYDFENDKYDTLICDAGIKPEGKFATRWPLRNYLGELFEVVIFFNDPPNESPQDHVKFYKWERVK